MDGDDGKIVAPVLGGEDAETHADDRGMMIPILLIILFVVGYGVYYEMFVADDEPAPQPTVEQPSDATTQKAVRAA